MFVIKSAQDDEASLNQSASSPSHCLLQIKSEIDSYL